MEKKGEGHPSFIEERRKLGGLVLNKSSLEENERSEVVVASHWLWARTACCC